MSLANLSAEFLYQKLPGGIVELDERFLIQAVVGGCQSRFEDVRAYGAKFNRFFSADGLPERGPNVVMVEVLSPAGKVYTHSLDITATTPTSPGQQLAWCAVQLGVPVAQLASPRLAVDAFRLVDARILDFLATNIGAVLYRSPVWAAQPDVLTSTGTYTAQEAAHQRLLAHYFPRLRLKGTARSFEAMGKLMGFDDVRMVPLWSRVSPHLPNDPGSPLNDGDFKEVPEFYPRQELNPFYDPLDQQDGPFYTWSGTASQGTSAQDFYPSAVNGYQPWIRVEVVGVQAGTAAHPAAGTYVLAGGGPHTRASVAAGEDLRFTALGEGASWNDIRVEVRVLDSAARRRLEITDRLSSVKYRSSFFNLGITMDADKADQIFGTLAAKASQDLAVSPHSYPSFSGILVGTSPYRPFVSGEAIFRDPTGVQTFDYLTSATGTLDSYTERYEADLSVRQQNYEDLASAGQATAQAMEEVRPATRQPRRASFGYLQLEAVAYAPLRGSECFLVVASPGSHNQQAAGVFGNAPVPPYTARVTFTTPTQVLVLAAEANDADPTALHYRGQAGGTLTGRIGLSGAGTNTYNFYASGTFLEAGTLCAQFYGTLGLANSPDSHEVVRVDPGTIADKRYMERPEDALDDDLVLGLADDYPWRRDVTGGGELVETDFMTFAGTTVQQMTEVGPTVAVKDQTGAEWDVLVARQDVLPASQGSRFVLLPRAIEGYVPGQQAIAFDGQFLDQARLTPNQLSWHAGTGGRTAYFRTELDAVFQPGYQLYHAGLVQGVLVADAASFNADGHARDLMGWLPLNEHALDGLRVADRADALASQVLTGVADTDRRWHSEQGAYLHLSPGARLEASARRECQDDLAISFWINFEAGTVAGPESVLRFGNVYFERYGTNGLQAVVRDRYGGPQVIRQLSLARWTFISLRKSSGMAVVGVGTFVASTSNFSEGAVANFEFKANTGVDGLTLLGGSLGCNFRDVRIWRSQKTAASLRKAYYHDPVPTVVPYRPSHVLSLNTGDHYGLKLLRTGWLSPVAMPAWVRAPKYARLVRYDGHGNYKGEAWRKEVGLGGGQLPPASAQLGQQFYGLTASAVLVAAPQLGAMPGNNAYWLKDATGAPGKYIVLSGYSASGSLSVVTTSGSGASPWPNRMEATNPVQETIWLPDDAGHGYAVRLEANSGYTARFAVTPGTQSYQEQTDALAYLAAPGFVLGVVGYGSVVQKVTTGTLTTPPLFMYLHDTLLEEVSGAQALARWTDPTVFGNSLGFPALKQAGELVFTNPSSLEPGLYRLKLDLGNKGRVDAGFDGYRLAVTLGDVVVTARVLQGFRGVDFRGVQELEFTLDHAIPVNWLLTLNWTNPLTDPERGTTRQLVLYGYTLRRLETNIFKVSLAVSGTTPVLTRLGVLVQNYGTVPGGWLLGYGSYGTVLQAVHEGTSYPVNDTLRSRYPLANLLTGRTADRREDVLVNGTFLLADVVDPGLGAFGVINLARSPSVLVTGAGSTAANGAYLFTREGGGVHYRKDASTYLACAPVDGQHQTWQSFYQGTLLYHADFTGDSAILANPATGAWQRDAGAAPVPGVRLTASGAALSQVGEYVACNIAGNEPSNPAPSYVWKFWDGSVIASGTDHGSALKLLNRGGNPAEGGSAPFKIPFRCDICDALGNVVQALTSTLTVNNPPTLYSAPQVVPNNQAFPFDAQLRVNAYDHESASLQFLWYQGAVPLGAGTLSGPVTVAGTYWGTLTGVNHDLYTSTFSARVTGSGTLLTCKVVDGSAGTTLVDFPLLGYDPKAPRFNVAEASSQITVDAGLQPTTVIGPAEVVDFTAYGFDPAPGVLVFTWFLHGSNGWNAPDVPVVSAGASAMLERGYRSTFSRGIGQEVGTGVRTAVVTVSNALTGRSASAEVALALVQNQAPELASIGVYDALTGQPVTTVSKQTAPARTLVRMSGTATDANYDVVFYQWDITAPVEPTTYTLYGRDIYLDVTDYPAASTQLTLGIVTAFDRYGTPSAPLALPPLTLV